MKLIGNFDEHDNLEKLHLDPVEECNIDDAKGARELTWVEALRSVVALEFEFQERGVNEIIADLLCQHCGFATGDGNGGGE